MSDIPQWLAIPVSLLLILSGIITLTGSLGLIRLRHFYSRIHAPTLGNTLGVFCVVVAVALVFSFLSSKPLLHPIIITVLLIVTSPVTAILLMRSAIKRERNERMADYAPDEPGHYELPTKHCSTDTPKLKSAENRNTPS